MILLNFVVARCCCGTIEIVAPIRMPEFLDVVLMGYGGLDGDSDQARHPRPLSVSSCTS